MAAGGGRGKAKTSFNFIGNRMGWKNDLIQHQNYLCSGENTFLYLLKCKKNSYFVKSYVGVICSAAALHAVYICWLRESSNLLLLKTWKKKIGYLCEIAKQELPLVSSWPRADPLLLSLFPDSLRGLKHWCICPVLLCNKEVES